MLSLPGSVVPLAHPPPIRAVPALQITGRDAPLVAAALVLGLAAVHVYARAILALGPLSRRRLLSFSGGVSVAFVFLHLLPEVEEARYALVGEGASHVLAQEVAYMIALAGFVTYYGIERAAKCAGEPTDGEPEARVFWVHIGSFAVYNALIGYLLVDRPQAGVRGMALFAAAMGLHFLVNDVSFQRHHAGMYRRPGRWLLAGAVVVGAAVGGLYAVHPGVLAGLTAFLAGGIVLNAIKEEVPSERQSRFWSFAAGAAGYSVLLLLV